jgi:hypothetical protein
MKKTIALAFLLIGLPLVGQVINCPSGFSSSGTCGVSNPGAGGQNFQIVAGGGVGVLAAPNVTLIGTGQVHQPAGLIYQTAVNAQAFTATFTFVPNGQNIAFVLQNNNNANASGTTDPKAFSSGAGCEGGFFQAFGTSPTSANNIFALELDGYSYLTASPGTFTYSSAQIRRINPRAIPMIRALSITRRTRSAPARYRWILRRRRKGPRTATRIQRRSPTMGPRSPWPCSM